MSEVVKGQQAVMDYDPNLVLCGRMAKQVVKLTFGEWKYRAVMEVTTYGNVTGLGVIEQAVGMAFDKLLGRKDFAKLVMKDSDGNTLTDDEGDDEDWLMDKLIKAEIISITPEV